jgi:hypothetical protein
MHTHTDISDRITVERIAPRKWAVTLDGKAVYSDRTLAWCEHWAGWVIAAETAEPGSIALLKTWATR